jgi:hypothetical protein
MVNSISEMEHFCFVLDIGSFSAMEKLSHSWFCVSSIILNKNQPDAH